MENENTENLDSTNEEETGEILSMNTEADVETTETEEVDVAELKKQNVKLFERAKKAEGFVKVNGQWVKKTKPAQKVETQKTTGLSNEDLLALTDVKNKDDRKFLIAESKVKGISVEELLEDPYAQAALKTMGEERTTSNATNTGKGKRGSTGASPEQIVDAHRAGKDLDPEKVAEAEHAIRMQQRQQ